MFDLKVFLLITKTELPPEKYPPEEEMSGEQKVLKHLGIKENLELDKIFKKNRIFLIPKI